MAFGRRKTKAEEPAGTAADNGTADEGTGDAGTGDAGQPGGTGPYDLSERPSEEGYIDLGALRIAASQGLQLRLEVEEKTQRVVAVTLDLEGSSLQLQAFAAPRSETLWDDIRSQIGKSVGSQGGTVDELSGTFGTELLAKVPAQAQDGSKGYRVARFVGVDGPRWFLRGVFGGPAAMNPEAAGPLEEVFRNVVVVRGEQPLPPRDLLQLRLPRDASPLPRPDAGTGKPAAPERGPEITTIG
ncbi:MULTISPECIES: DUF3710 domain-containing protein [unclassified Arthrobacter]|uniref:DUF3710 domain-containing protein n=1 Tax=unclassified Arthrobacter TaxID=235627 RepID=UPI001D159352|nr:MULTISPECIES: DUF3710 domain-containing protein [unclassified Arthrobacter]MCC3274408.1 DUF3710 domain-containing protein [Arthrobacter sp. zg-Y20]MCC3279597.1 DUF3710 domain-containing protein [Arthrobacter sp. zg-Y40]MCC9177998.1 DUF3710 domain-containing protein [Arthrobacter sp. zg-Y750]MDK1314564.1 DUF3710 domain-containing protein [Arthrobacter sp. zg.Y20]MDK1327452.1 DUF3710 domain-containing protein [Arthrobacter sp. zg-Y1143]